MEKDIERDKGGGMKYLEIRRDFIFEANGLLRGIYVFDTDKPFIDFGDKVINENFLVESNDEAILVNIPDGDPNITKALAIGFGCLSREKEKR